MLRATLHKMKTSDNNTELSTVVNILTVTQIDTNKVSLFTSCMAAKNN